MLYRLAVVAAWLAAAVPTVVAQPAAPPDSVDILAYDLGLEVYRPDSAWLRGQARITFRWLKPGLQRLALDLEALTVESVRGSTGQALAFRQTPRQVMIDLGSEPHTPADSQVVELTYSGVPRPPSGFGGVTFERHPAAVMYTIGAALHDVPHSVGRMWFPCRDTFTDKARFSYRVRTVAPYKAVCGGEFQTARPLGPDTTEWVYELRQPIPPYLASVAVGEFDRADLKLQSAGQGQGRYSIPAEIHTPKGRAAHAYPAFNRLNEVFNHFVGWFGPYRWPKVGYVGVPFYAGAMEHALNIAYPSRFIDSTRYDERLWAHELAHAWFGNLVTCSHPQDMWLNEGFARWAEALYLEAVRGPAHYHDYIRKLHLGVAGAPERPAGGKLILAAMPQSHTYSKTTYDKGGLAAHALRSALGDSLLRQVLQTWFRNHAFGNASTDDFEALIRALPPSEERSRALGVLATLVRQADLPAFEATRLPNGQVRLLRLEPHVGPGYPLRLEVVNKSPTPRWSRIFQFWGADTVLTGVPPGGLSLDPRLEFPTQGLNYVVHPETSRADSAVRPLGTQLATRCKKGSFITVNEVHCTPELERMLELPPGPPPTGTHRLRVLLQIDTIGMSAQDTLFFLTGGLVSTPDRPLAVCYRPERGRPWVSVAALPVARGTDRVLIRKPRTGQYCIGTFRP
jgi:aminopeptidase N